MGKSVISYQLSVISYQLSVISISATEVRLSSCYRFKILKISDKFDLIVVFIDRLLVSCLFLSSCLGVYCLLTQEKIFDFCRRATDRG
ncbi:MAG: hypothetical protein EWV55_14285 [Microcystis viridis Mv_BB_P_19951000_S69]|uniref:Uncharacterized protein n=1 Tax=Microcystis viridis Mv_BB_P_19951000_S68D TaxID=2486270 RepID=A0A552HP32_MICVR|nr:MAG: hypothetical protein EWV47_18385 [Microcystis viridis Mv_BB_P_19951000_S68]TRU72663.1 MAG: hypothetical protein EWV55_14285 [Microcystis viridis Mv_BB_P_19951000_S69]TRU72963.1 MAG: hypothetical protein EWV77_12690 [Microcystis viridis Mv_BB_P_19951000_S68D]TRU85991.1 MAG: hypothetical protein EWV46_11270 [Microcystis viridis Mv_BB_P_19951000_S69D]